MKVYEIPGKPIAWKRARRCGNRYFDPQVNEKKAMQYYIKLTNKTISCATKPLKVLMEFYMPIPESWSRTRRLNALNAPHVFTSDLDNKIKMIGDTFNGILWKDDALIYEIHARKIYSNEPKTRIYIQEYDQEQLLPLHPE